MPLSWEEANAASISAFRSVAADVGETYQQVLYGESGYRQSRNYDPMQGVGNRGQVNPEYGNAERAYEAQEQEREYWDGVGVEDYQPTDLDWEAYGKYLDDYERENPAVELIGPPEPDEPDFER
jgi:hypothetical protein